MGGTMKINLIFLIFLYSFSSVKSWVWQCDQQTGFCTRTHNATGTTYPSVEVCRLICGNTGALWPLPTGVTQLSHELVDFNSNKIRININLGNRNKQATTFLKNVAGIFKSNLPRSKSCRSKNSLNIQLTVASASLTLDWSTDESYELEVITERSNINVGIIAHTIFGARHGLETLSQLIAAYNNRIGSCLVINTEAQITDRPVYPHRGLMLDTARSFLEICDLQKHIDGMGASKLNVLHWHLTDSQSFPFASKSRPIMAQSGAYSDKQVYQTKDIENLIAYAKLRGVRVIMEIDAPAHASNGWQWGPQAGLGDLINCYEAEPFYLYCIEPPCGQINPVNPNVFTVFKDLYSDLTKLLPKGEVFHIGGDEVFIPCWESTPEIVDFLTAEGKDVTAQETYLELWSNWEANLTATFDSVVGNTNTPLIMWYNQLTNTSVIEQYIPKDRYVIQAWLDASDPTPEELLALGYRVIVSTFNTWYLNNGFFGTDPYSTWSTVYDNKIPVDPNCLGGEVALFTELADNINAEKLVWPRAAAAAERLWTNLDSMTLPTSIRLFRHRKRLVDLGIKAEAIIYDWCYDVEGICYF